MSEQFDFSELIKNLVSELQKGPQPRGRIHRILLDPKIIARFSAHQLTKNFGLGFARPKTLGLSESPAHALSFSGVQNPYSQYDMARDADFRMSGGKRIIHTHPLDSDEFDHAISLMQTYPEVESVLNLMDFFIQRYVDAIYGIYDPNFRSIIFNENGTAREELRALRVNYDAGEFQHSLCPIFLSALDVDKALENISGEDLKEGHTKCFKRMAFQSYVPEKQKTIKCPMGQAFGPLWNTEFAKDTEGNWFVTGKKKSGGFFDAVMQKLKDEGIELPKAEMPSGECPFHQAAE